ncbi:MAG TPA: DNA cytosine methyltransferase [Chthoniobacterales bacterium]|nr:DNA cytosine methyltransferase [Chthoniobacterales bacterium]
MLDVELFAGGGGMAVGLRAAGFYPATLYERDQQSCATLRYNLGAAKPTLIGTVNEQHIEKFLWDSSNEEVRLLAAGTPCQPFSLGGSHKAHDDPRNLFPDLLRVVRLTRPRAVLVENVRGLIRPLFRSYFEYVLRQLECPSIAPRPGERWFSHDVRIRECQVSLGYEPEYRVEYHSLDAADFGVPQRRFRVFIVALRREFGAFDFPKPTHSRVALVASKQTGEYWDLHGVPKRQREHVEAALPLNGTSSTVPWITVRQALNDLPKPTNQESNAWMNHWIIDGARTYGGHSGSSLDWPSKTIKAGVHGVPGGENTLVDSTGRFRYYTLREAARLQTFPDNHFFSGARIHVTRQIGNAVPCVLATILGRALHPLISRNPKDNYVTNANTH